MRGVQKLGDFYSLFCSTLLSATVTLVCTDLMAQQSSRSVSVIQNSKFLFTPYSSSKFDKTLFDRMGDKKIKLLWNLGLDGQSLGTDRNNQSQVASLQSQLQMKSQLTPALSLNGEARIRFRSGRTQFIFGDQESGTNIYLRHGSLKYQTWRNRITLEGGVLSQRKMLNNPLLVSTIGFPGVHQKLFYGGPKWGVSLGAQQSIPVSSTLGTRVQEREVTPVLFSEYLSLDWFPVRGTAVTARLGWFNFNNLPATVAYWSQVFGNTFTGNGQNNAFFAYDFNGWNTQLLLDQSLSRRWAVQLQGNFLRNVAAPDTLNESQIIKATVAYESNHWIFSLKGESFFSEPDSAPAFYNSWRRGHNNRVGWGLGAAAESKNRNFRMFFEYFDARLLNINTFSESIQQDDQKTVVVGLETAYDLF